MNDFVPYSNMKCIVERLLKISQAHIGNLSKSVRFSEKNTSLIFHILAPFRGYRFLVKIDSIIFCEV